MSDAGTGSFRKVEDRYARYDVVAIDGDNIGKVDHTFVDEANQQEYIAVSRGGIAGLIPGTGSSVIPIDVCTVDNNTKTIEVSADKDVIKNSPSLGSGEEMTPEYETQVRSYYRL